MSDYNEFLHGNRKGKKFLDILPVSLPPHLEANPSHMVDGILPPNSTEVLQSNDTGIEMLDTRTAYYPDSYTSHGQDSNILDNVSYVNIDTPIGLTSITVRTYSDNSNHLSEFSGDRLYSAPSHGSIDDMWVHGADFQVDNDVIVPQLDRNIFLFDMGTEVLRTKHNPYQEMSMGGYEEDNADHEYMVNYNTYSESHEMGQESVSRTSRPQSASEEPWNPVGPYKVPCFVPGDIAFAPSPGPALCQGLQYVDPRAAGLQWQQLNKDCTNSVESPTACELMINEYKTPTDPQWINLTGQEDTEQDQRRSGVRKGRLDPEVAAKARRVREVKACWKCRIQKVSCSEGEVCETCKKQFPDAAQQMCCRSALSDYLEVFFPDWLHSHLKKIEIQRLITENTLCFHDTILDVEVSTGAAFEPLKVQTHVFHPKTWEILGQYQLISNSPGQGSQLVYHYSAPIGMISLLVSDMKIQCKKHIEAMIDNIAYAAQVSVGHETLVPRIILEVAQKYSAKMNSSLLRDALKLHAIHYCMGALLTLTPTSAHKVYETVETAGAPPGEYLSSRLLSRQLKYAMHLLHREIYKDVLEHLEKSLKSRSKESWGTSFCTLLVLCLCIEELQTAADIFIALDIGRYGTNSQYSRSQSVRACLALEQHPFEQYTRLFHDIYRSSRQENTGGPARKCGINPFRAPAGAGKRETMDKPTCEMLDPIREMIHNSYNDLVHLSERPSMTDDNLCAEDLSVIKAYNNGRLAAKFLRQFIQVT